MRKLVFVHADLDHYPYLEDCCWNAVAFGT